MGRAADIGGPVPVAAHRRDTQAVELLLAHCAAARRSDPRRPVLERLRDRIGAELACRLLFALTGVHRMRSARRLG